MRKAIAIAVCLVIGAIVTTTVVFIMLAILDNCYGDCSFPFVTRKEWHARPTRNSETMKTPVQYAFIHHTHSPSACYTREDCIQKVQQVQDFHMDVRGWDDIGYSFVVGSDGSVYEGRGWHRVGAHTYGYNSVGVGIAVMGDYTNVVPNNKALNVLKQLLACGVEINALQANYTLRGHRDMVKTTECPGQAFYDLIRTWPHYWS